MRPPALFAVSSLLALAGAAAPGFASALPAPAQVYQQRTPDGGVLLTDHPAPGARTERSWQVEREDPVAARQRARDVETEARLVSERIQHRLDEQRRAAQADAQLQLARIDAERAGPEVADEGLVANGIALWSPHRLRAGRRAMHDGREHRGGRAPHAAPHGVRLTGPAAPESR